MTDSPSEIAATRDLYTRMSAPQLAQMREDYETDLARALQTRKGAKLEGAKPEQLEPLDATVGSLRFRLGMIDDMQLGRELRQAEALESQTLRMLQTIEAEQLQVVRSTDTDGRSVWHIGERQDETLSSGGATLPLAFEAWQRHRIGAAAKEVADTSTHLRKEKGLDPNG